MSPRERRERTESHRGHYVTGEVGKDTAGPDGEAQIQRERSIPECRHHDRTEAPNKEREPDRVGPSAMPKPRKRLIEVRDVRKPNREYGPEKRHFERPVSAHYRHDERVQ